jgi:hypothetical protein
MSERACRLSHASKSTLIMRGAISWPTKAHTAPIAGQTLDLEDTGLEAGAGERTVIDFFAPFGSCTRIAPLRQAERHAWHSWHKRCSICATPFTSRIAPEGQMPTHSLQPVQRASFTYTTVITFFLYRSDMHDLSLN